jgi:hypothetical protein
MRTMTVSLLRFCLLPVILVLSARAQQWTAPAPEELTMTSVPQVPGAAAVYLYKEETQDDSYRMWSYYYRVKVLTEGGKDMANVELPYIAGANGWTIDSIAGRTVHPDGSVTLFAGKPYDKLIEKVGGYKVNAKVFSLPDVQVGSILEYRYKLRYDDSHFTSPDWYVQSDLYTRKAHYSWKPTTQDLHSDIEEGISSVAWTPILPVGASVKQVSRGGANYIELDVSDIMPLPNESFMPPMNSLSQRVMFYYTSYKTSTEYWNHAGKYWSNARNKFMDYGSATKNEVKELIQPGDTDEQKVQKIYAFVGTLDNTTFTRSHSLTEDRAQGFSKEVTTVDDVLKRKRGNDDQITTLFVAMVRAAGMKAYLMGVADRKQRIFLPSYLSLGQLDDDVAIVPINGKDVFFDPGQRYCAFGHLSWKHSNSVGLRQTENGTMLISTPGESYKEEHTSRIADLTLDEQGSATGTVTVSYQGDPALAWRQEALRGDDTSLNKDLRTDMEETLPGGMEVRVTKVDNLSDISKPLKITYEIKGPVGSATGKRLLVPASLFESNTKTKFTSAKREMPVDMHYASIVQDAVRFKLPADFVIESAPAESKEMFQNFASYTTSTKAAPNAITLYRNMINGRVIYTNAEYPELRSFYNKLEAKDQESLVLTRASAATPATTAKVSE